MWEDVGQQLASILKAQLFPCLLETRAYKILLQKAGFKEPFEQYTKDRRPPFPDAYKGYCDTYAALIKSQVQQQNCLVDDRNLRADVIKGPVNLYRVVNSRGAIPERTDLRRGTADIGDWWFNEDLLENCRERCRTLEEERKRDRLLTDMTPDRCLRTLLRRNLAISINWNAIGAIRQLKLSGTDSIPVITGVGIGMAAYSADADRKKYKSKTLPVAKQKLLGGGERQIWIPWTPERRHIQLWTPRGGLGPNAEF
ncbi:MAG TPA: hypothetical protein VH601_21860 [Bryobacteraceae bacterium]|jgi:hypothetical protein